MMYFILLLSFAALIYGADLMVRGAVNIAAHLGISTLVIGLTLVAWGTSAPELVVSLRAGLSGNYGLAIGNILGSNIANILLIGGVAAVLIVLKPKGTNTGRNLWLMAGITVAVGVAVLLGELPRWVGATLLVIQVGLIILAFCKGEADEEVELENMSLPKASFLTLAGLALVILGGLFLVPAAVDIANAWGVPQPIIGLSILAVGTSLPELAATLAAVRQKENDIILGNIVGSNIANILIVFGFTALIAPGTLTSPHVYGSQVLIMGLATAALMALLLIRGHLARTTGLLFLSAYTIFIAYSYLFLT